MAREKFLRKRYFSTERIVGSALELSSKMFFSLDKYRFRNIGLKLWFCFSPYMYMIEKKVVEVLYTPSPRDQVNPFEYNCSFTLHTTY